MLKMAAAIRIEEPFGSGMHNIQVSLLVDIFLFGVNLLCSVRVSALSASMFKTAALW